METNIEQRSAIKFCWKADKTGMETYELLWKAYGEECVSRATTFLWFGKFWDGREDEHDNEWAGRPRTSWTNDNIAAVLTALQHNSRSTVRLLEEQLHINRETIRYIIIADLGKKNLHSLRAACVNSGAKSRPFGLGLLEEQLHINRETIRYIIIADLGKKNLHLLRAARGAKSRPCGLVRRPSHSALLRPGIFDHNCGRGWIVVFCVQPDY